MKKDTERKTKKTGKEDPEQSRRFVEVAEAPGADKDGKKFKEAIDSISKPKPKPKN